MPRKVSFKTKPKTKFRGNQFQSKDGRHRPNLNDKSSEPRPTEINSPKPNSRPSQTVSSSSKKLFRPMVEYDNYESIGKGNCIFALTLISKAIKSFVKCKFCDQENCVELNILEGGRHGLAVNVELSCSLCFQSIKFSNSNHNNNNKKYDINVMFVYALRAIGRGLAAGNVFCALMDLPSPPQKFQPYNDVLVSAIENCAKESMKVATDEAVKVNLEVNPDTEQMEPSTDLAVCLDGSWQRRGHLSLNGFVSVTSFDTGKVLDVSIMSKYCQFCAVAKDKGTVKDHNCTKNYSGTSGGMEVAGAIQVFKNSVDRGVRYVKYLGDGDSNGFKKVSDDKPYGEEIEVIKLECVNHVKKRMGSRLKQLKKGFGKQKLEDGKSLGGRNRLTDKEIYKLQEYYGLAITRAGSDLDQMKKNVWATYFHKISTDENPQHNLCPVGSDSWCGFNKAKVSNGTYTHKNSLPFEIMVTIKKIFRDLADPALLKRCLHQKTQNPNESFNNIVWNKIPKNIFVRLNTFKLGVFDSVLSFNDGFSSKLAIYKLLGLSLNKKAVTALRDLDVARMKKADKAAENMTKESRIARRKRKIAEEDKEEQAGGPAYGAGMF